MYSVLVIGDDGFFWKQDCETEHDAIEYAEYLNRLHFKFIAVQDPNEKEILKFENE